MKKLLMLAMVACLQASNFDISENCTYENDKFWIKIIELCKVSEIPCNKVVYIGMNKKTRDHIVLEGQAVLGDRAAGYLFLSNDYQYEIFTRNHTQLDILDEDYQVVYSGKLLDCDDE